LAWKDIRKPDLLDKLLHLLALQIGQEVSLNELGQQLAIKTETVETYLNVLEKSFIIFRLKSYSSNQRKEVTKMRKIFFWDNGIRNAIVGDFRSVTERNDMGALWENFMIAERIKQNQNLQKNTSSFFWRSLQQQEVDYVEIENKQIKAFEMKWKEYKKMYVTKAFTNLYPKAKTAIVQPSNFVEFCHLK
jgi:predicted AAA+ superfamily ATPase